MTSRRTLIGLLVLSIASTSVAAFGLVVSHKSAVKVEVFQTRCLQLLEQNSMLRVALQEASQPTERNELVITVAGTEYAPKTLARANRNLLNIRQMSNGEKFEGQIGVDKHRHCIFSHPAYSVRAGAMILRNYERRHGIRTLSALVKRFCESNHKEYASFLSKGLGIGVDQEFSITAELHRLLPLMIRFETGEKIGQEYAAIIAAVRG